MAVEQQKIKCKGEFGCCCSGAGYSFALSTKTVIYTPEVGITSQHHLNYLKASFEISTQTHVQHDNAKCDVHLAGEYLASYIHYRQIIYYQVVDTMSSEDLYRDCTSEQGIVGSQ